MLKIDLIWAYIVRQIHKYYYKEENEILYTKT